MDYFDRILRVLAVAGLVGSTIASAWKALPEDFRSEVERQQPRFANAMRWLTAVCADVPKMLVASRAIARGTAKPPLELREYIPSSDPDQTPPATPSAIARRAREAMPPPPPKDSK